MLGGAYFAGFGISAAIVPRYSDIYGRKKPYFLCIFIQTCAYFGILNSREIHELILFYLFVGLCAGGRVSIGSQYLCEFVPKKFQTTVTTG
jgi:MFS family permease